MSRIEKEFLAEESGVDYDSLFNENNIVGDFDDWWNFLGSGILPKKNEDKEEFAKRISQEAWIARSKQNE